MAPKTSYVYWMLRGYVLLTLCAAALFICHIFVGVPSRRVANLVLAGAGIVGFTPLLVVLVHGLFRRR
jgi:hypothetical protein